MYAGGVENERWRDKVGKCMRNANTNANKLGVVMAIMC